MLYCRIITLEPISKASFKSINLAQAIIHFGAVVDSGGKGLFLLKKWPIVTKFSGFRPNTTGRNY